MPWEVDDHNNVVMQDGNPVFIYPDGKKAPFNADSTINAINKANSEAADRRIKLKELTEMVKPLKDVLLDDFTPENVSAFIADATKNKEVVSNYEDKDFVAAGDVEKIKSQAVENVKNTYEQKIKDMSTLFSNKEQDYQNQFAQMEGLNRELLIESEFKGSDFIKNNTSIPYELFYNTYGKNFSIEYDDDNRPIVKAKRADGSDVISLSKPGQFADPSEAIEILINEHPQKESFLKGYDRGGSESSNVGRNTKHMRIISNRDQEALSANIENIAAGKARVEM